MFGVQERRSVPARPGDVIYWTPDGDGAADKARAFCRSRGLSGDDVRLVKRTHAEMGRMVMVEVKRPCKLKVGS